MTNMENPCKGCDKRVIGCHASCFRHKLFNHLRQRKKAEIKKSKVYEDYIGIKKHETILRKEKERLRKKK